MKRVIFKFLSIVVLIFFIYAILLFSFWGYHKNKFVQECLEDGRSQEWCEQTWKELSAID